MEYLKVALWIAEIVFGIGFVIFFHELGHFIMAKRNGVRVELFSLGFGRPVWKRRWGETEYRIAWIPLGGFVSMAGEQGQEGDVPQPYELSAKSPWQRFQIFVAGATMNLLLAFPICIIAFLVGKEQHRPTVGVPGVAESLGGILPGDEIQAVDGQEIATIEEYRMTMAGQETGKTVHVRVKRGADILEIPVTQRGAMQHQTSPSSSVVGELKPEGLFAKAGLQAGDHIVGIRQEYEYADPVPPREKINEDMALAPDDRVTEVKEGGLLLRVERAVSTTHRLEDVIVKSPDRDVVLQVRRDGRDMEFTVRVPAKEDPKFARDERMIEPIIKEPAMGSAASYDGDGTNGRDDTLRGGDRIVEADGRPVASFADLRAAVESNLGKPLNLEIVRKIPAPGSHPLFGGLSIFAVLGILVGGALLVIAGPVRWLYLRGADAAKQWTVVGVGAAVAALIGTGLFYLMPPTAEIEQRAGATLTPTHGPRGRGVLGIEPVPTNIIADITPGGPFDRAGLKSGDRLESVGTKTGDVKVNDLFEWDPKKEGPDLKVLVTRKGEKKPLPLVLRPEPRVVGDAEAMGYEADLNRFYRRWSAKDAVVEGVKEPFRIMVLTVGLLKKLVTGEESAKGMAGPAGIFQFSYKSAQVGPGNFLWLLALITVNLGVFNLLPIPALDGGHIALLGYEVVARRKPSAAFAMTYQVVGLLLLLALIVFVTYNDIERMIGG